MHRDLKALLACQESPVPPDQVDHWEIGGHRAMLDLRVWQVDGEYLDQKDQTETRESQETEELVVTLDFL